MITLSISNLSYLRSVFATSLETAAATNRASGTGTSSLAQSGDGQFSSFARILSTLQQIQQSNPGQYVQDTQRIATNLQQAAKTATSEGNSTAANQLNQLAVDFTNASTSDQLPDIRDLAQAAFGQSHHRHHHHGSSAGVSSLLAALQTNVAPATSLNPISIISETLSTSVFSNISQNNSLNPLSIISNTLSNAQEGGATE